MAHACVPALQQQSDPHPSLILLVCGEGEEAREITVERTLLERNCKMFKNMLAHKCVEADTGQVKLSQYQAEDITKFVTLLKVSESAEELESLVGVVRVPPALTSDVVEEMLPLAFYFDAPCVQRMLRDWIAQHPTLSLLIAHDTVSPDGWTWPEGSLNCLLFDFKDVFDEKHGQLVMFTKDYQSSHNRVNRGTLGVVTKKGHRCDALYVRVNASYFAICNAKHHYALCKPTKKSAILFEKMKQLHPETLAPLLSVSMEASSLLACDML